MDAVSLWIVLRLLWEAVVFFRLEKLAVYHLIDFFRCWSFWEMFIWWRHGDVLDISTRHQALPSVRHELQLSFFPQNSSTGVFGCRTLPGKRSCCQLHVGRRRPDVQCWLEADDEVTQASSPDTAASRRLLVASDLSHAWRSPYPWPTLSNHISL